MSNKVKNSKLALDLSDGPKKKKVVGTAAPTMKQKIDLVDSFIEVQEEKEETHIEEQKIDEDQNIQLVRFILDKFGKCLEIKEKEKSIWDPVAKGLAKKNAEKLRDAQKQEKEKQDENQII